MTNRNKIDVNELNQVNGGFIFWKQNANGTYTCAVYDENKGWEYFIQYGGEILDIPYNYAKDYALAHKISTKFCFNPQTGNPILKFDDVTEEEYLATGDAMEAALNKG